MKEDHLKILNDAGINTEEALSRLMGNEALFFKVLEKFSNDTNFSNYMSELEAGNLQDAEQYLHALKGIAGNLGVTKVYELSAEIDAGLKEGALPEKEKNSMLKKAYETAIEAVAKLNIK